MLYCPGSIDKPPEKAAAANRDKLEVKVEKDPAAAKAVGLKIAIPERYYCSCGWILDSRQK